MRVAFISQPWDDMIPRAASGSLPVWTYEITRRLARWCDVIVYARRGGGRRLRLQKNVEWDEGVQYRRYSMVPDMVLLRLRKCVSRERNITRPLFASDGYHRLYIGRVARDLLRTRPDIVHVSNFSQWVPIVQKWYPPAKIVLHMHCEWLTQLDQSMIDRRLGLTDMIIGCSQYVTQKIRRRFPEYADRCKTVHDGVDVDRFRPRNNDRPVKRDAAPCLLFVGRVSPEKGVHVLLEAFQRVIVQYPGAQLKIVGPRASAPEEFIVKVGDAEKVRRLASFYGGENYSDLLERMARGAGGRVSFSGPLLHREVVEDYQHTDVFVVPSVWDEAFGMPVIEAMACGVAVVATRVGGIPEIVEDGKSGLLVEAANAEALAEAIIDLLGNADRRRSLGEAGRQRVVERFSWDGIAERLMEEYRRMVRTAQKDFANSVGPSLSGKPDSGRGSSSGARGVEEASG